MQLTHAELISVEGAGCCVTSCGVVGVVEAQSHQRLNSLQQCFLPDLPEL
jgi:hypothetical protein